jgi:hypothetical protein
MARNQITSPIRFVATPQTVEKSTIVRLPDAASKKLPSRGQVAVEGTIDGHAFQTVLEPDGDGGHWIRVEPKLERAVDLEVGEAADIAIEPTKEWPEPAVPDDLGAALEAAPEKIRELWKEITPMARWEWVRWVNATRNPETRGRRVEVTISKLSGGKRRPCCFDLSACTDPDLAKNGKLVDSGK